MDHVPTVFVELPPPPPPPQAPPPRVDTGGLFISRGFLGVLVVLFLGAAIAGTGFFYFQYSAAQTKVTAADRTIADLKATLVARDAKLTEQTNGLATRDNALKAHELQYGQIEALNAQAAKLQKDIEELLPRRPGTPGISDKIKAPLWRDGAVQQLTRYVADLQKEFTRIDRAPGAIAPAAPTTPRQPNIQTTPGTSPS
ncbi:MAG: hypothetical protein IPO30_07890 [Hyphomonadaceae bacterium]|jgi:hypothetical protein|nr:hypothetical protein [Hyphomonadaceae bacterium]